mmetsp:Transcript_38594/g.123835  ORF Transcript_38594/g.123835 Transcript_38594/m.123835 type:complete len:296 (+) Transcript_38594:277-1164(+)
MADTKMSSFSDSSVGWKSCASPAETQEETRPLVEVCAQALAHRSSRERLRHGPRPGASAREPRRPRGGGESSTSKCCCWQSERKTRLARLRASSTLAASSRPAPNTSAPLREFSRPKKLPHRARYLSSAARPSHPPSPSPSRLAGRARGRRAPALVLHHSCTRLAATACFACRFERSASRAAATMFRRTSCAWCVSSARVAKRFSVSASTYCSTSTSSEMREAAAHSSQRTIGQNRGSWPNPAHTLAAGSVSRRVGRHSHCIRPPKGQPNAQTAPLVVGSVVASGGVSAAEYWSK